MTPPRRVREWLTLGLLTITIGLPFDALACATCVSSAFGDRTFNWAFLGLMAAPFVVAGVVGGIIFHAFRRTHEPGR